MRETFAEALVVGHPGHELRVHGWLSAVQPLTFVLTDGSGATGIGRIESSRAVIRDAGAWLGSVAGDVPDALAYDAILRRDAGPFCNAARVIARDLERFEVRTVAGDAWEGYNPVHDVCRGVIDAAALIASKRLGTTIETWSFPLLARPDDVRPCATTRTLVLDDAAFERKMQLADRYSELASDVRAALDTLGREAFRTEVLTREDVSAWNDERFLSEDPFYESHGRARVRDGKYASVISYRDHVRPIVDSLREFAENA